MRFWRQFYEEIDRLWISLELWRSLSWSSNKLGRRGYVVVKHKPRQSVLSCYYFFFFCTHLSKIKDVNETVENSRKIWYMNEWGKRSHTIIIMMIMVQTCASSWVTKSDPCKIKVAWTRSWVDYSSKRLSIILFVTSIWMYILTRLIGWYLP